jgi:hypothetical protein
MKLHARNALEWDPKYCLVSVFSLHQLFVQ